MGINYLEYTHVKSMPHFGKLRKAIKPATVDYTDCYTYDNIGARVTWLSETVISKEFKARVW